MKNTDCSLVMLQFHYFDQSTNQKLYSLTDLSEGVELVLLLLPEYSLLLQLCCWRASQSQRLSDPSINPGQMLLDDVFFLSF